MVVHPCPIQKPGCKGTTHDAVCSNCVQPGFEEVTCWNCNQQGHYSRDCPSGRDSKRQRYAGKAATSKNGGDELPTVVPRAQRCGEFSRLNRQERRIGLQTPARLDIVATVAASRAGGYFFNAEAFKAYKAYLCLLEQENNEFKKTAVKSEPASPQKPASKQQSSESTQKQKQKARAHKAAVETLRVAEVKREIIDAKENEGSTYDELANFIELSLSGVYVLPDLFAGTEDSSIIDDPEI